jgi:molybdenum cofactor biosynthesis enzyme MoaA
MTLCSIDDKTEKQLMVIWDLGRRCTFACSYCPPHRKNNWSTLASFDELVKTADSLERYSEIYNAKRNERFRVAASFTGGEPTVNPEFFRFLEYLQEKYPHWKRTLTTNGFYSKRRLETVMKNTNFTTVSYHCEGSEAQKKQVRENLQTMHDAGYGFKINIMFHENPDYFNECVYIAQWCDDRGVQYTPRVIGDQGDIKTGLKNKTVHTYTETQMSWFKNYWKAKESKEPKPAYYASNPPKPAAPPAGTMAMISNQPEEKKEVGQKIGRPCCGGRQLDLGFDDGSVSEGSFVTNNNFQGWSCMVNWYFLYIHQEVDRIYHHQTCQVNLNGEIGSICKVSTFDEYCDKLEAQFNTGRIPFIRCPKTHCGCGLCVPKARVDKVATSLFNYHAPGIVPEQMEMKDIGGAKGSLKAEVYKFDESNGDLDREDWG